ncbi:MAG: hypothetical protein NZM18_07300 [Thermoflexales bacterium]|nr:hypothetical protein [Thermoflexales bacterium]MDW8351207.1 hypothetical protein [Anaerolineae bacterium]
MEHFEQVIVVLPRTLPLPGQAVFGFQACDCLHPAREAALKGHRAQPDEHPPTGQIEECGRPVAFEPMVALNGHSIICAGDNGQNNDDGLQQVWLAVISARVGYN